VVKGKSGASGVSRASRVIAELVKRHAENPV
jgi:hypothetical protein